MTDELKNKIIVKRMSESDILVENTNDNFIKELTSMGFSKLGQYYSLNIPVKETDKRIDLIKKLIKIDAVFSYGREWSPSEFIDYYNEIGLLKCKCYRIFWKKKDDFYIVFE